MVIYTAATRDGATPLVTASLVSSVNASKVLLNLSVTGPYATALVIADSGVRVPANCGEVRLPLSAEL